MRYQVDPLHETDSDSDLSPPLVVEVYDAERPHMRPLVGPGDRAIGAIAVPFGSRVGRAVVRLTSEDPQLERRVAALREAIRKLRNDLETDLTPFTADGRELASADEEAEFRSESAFATLLAYAAFAVELETERG